MRGADAWARRRRTWRVAVDYERLRLSAEVDHPREGQGLLLILADLDDYRVVPPAWRFVDEAGNSPKSAWPAPGERLGGGGSIFHSQLVLCAPFNRLAYAQHGGPHGDWGAPTNWLAERPGIVRASNLGEMLAVIDLHLSVSPGRMS